MFRKNPMPLSSGIYSRYARLVHRKSIIIIHSINRLRNKNQIITSINSEKNNYKNVTTIYDKIWQQR